MASVDGMVRFEPLSVRVDVEFWFDLERRKLTEYRGSMDPVPLHATYTTAAHPTLSAAVVLGPAAFGPHPPPPYAFSMAGTLVNTNTLEELKRYDRKALLDGRAAAVWQSIASGAWIHDPGVLQHLLLLCFADLKQHKFLYCAGFPVLLPAHPFTQTHPPVPVASVLDGLQQSALHAAFSVLRGTAGAAGAFAVTLTPGGDLQVHPLTQWAEVTAAPDRRVWLAVADPCSQVHVVGWPARNVLWALTHHFKLEGTIHLLCYREVPSRQDISQSIIVEVAVSASHLLAEGRSDPDYAGWPADNKLKTVDLSPLLDEEKLSRSSANLNLSLMKWRMLPSLDLTRLERCKCLLIGAGTLGCNVARTLLMWGVTHITLLDYGKVSYSNPARQTLFEFADAKAGRPKAEAAAAACRRIYPGCQVEAVSLSVPMPGHPVDAPRRAAVAADVATLDALVHAADVVFLLLDSREGRWLPTLLCAHHDRLCINAALGFASYMAMRHGVRAQPPDQRLGCYFCSEVSAPRDSLSDRTLDQQCTVTRPGVSAMASALAVELMAAALQHPLGAAAPADSDHDDPTSLLGLVPHQIRGQVDSFQQNLLHGRAYDRCTACSAAVVDRYRAEGFAFVERALNDPASLEDVTGLRQVKEDADRKLKDLEAADRAQEGSDDEEWTM